MRLKGLVLIAIAGLLIIISAITFTYLRPGQIGRMRSAGGEETSIKLPALIEAVTPTDAPLQSTPPIQTPLLPKLAPAPGNVSFDYGIQADPNGNIEVNISSIQELGFAWVKLPLPWKEIEPTPGSYDWQTWDELVDAYAAHGIQVMLTISKAPDWARPADDDKSVDGLPADPATYASFVAQVSERYQGKVQAVEIWFWNRHHSWCFLGTMEAYLEVMAASGDLSKFIAITEFGWGVSDNPQPGYEYIHDNIPAEQAQWIVEAYVWAKQQGWIGPMILGNLDYGVGQPDDWRAPFGVLNTPAYEALVKMPK